MKRKDVLQKRTEKLLVLAKKYRDTTSIQQEANDIVKKGSYPSTIEEIDRLEKASVNLVAFNARLKELILSQSKDHEPQEMVYTQYKKLKTEIRRLKITLESDRKISNNVELRLLTKLKDYKEDNIFYKEECKSLSKIVSEYARLSIWGLIKLRMKRLFRF